VTDIVPPEEPGRGLAKPTGEIQAKHRFVRSLIITAYEGLTVREPSEVLADEVEADMRVPEAVRDALAPLEQEGFALTDTYLEGTFDEKQRQVSMLLRDGERYYLAHLPTAIVKSDAGPSKRLLACLGLIFPEASTVFFVSHLGDAMQVSLENILNAYKGVRARFIPWLHLIGSNGALQPPRLLLDAFDLQRRSLDGRALDLSDTPAIEPPPPLAAAPAGRRAMTAPAKATVAGSLSAHLSVNDGREFFDDFIARMNLSDPAAGRARSQWNDDATIASLNLIRWADVQGVKVLTRVLVLLIEEAPGRHDTPALLGVLESCGRATDEELQKLRKLIEDAE
jgi:hypothetical protein